RGMESAAHALLARALLAEGAGAKASEHIATALSLREQGYTTDQLPALELDAVAIELLAVLDPPRADTLLQRAVQWLHTTAETEVPEPLRHGFLHMHPVHRALLAQAQARAKATAAVH
ncbi:MAG: hypothetical protein LH480_11195, partial [Rubrivivax sp.]|nr:hypothetical protein [Rubrivivax sp.]